MTTITTLIDALNHFLINTYVEHKSNLSNRNPVNVLYDLLNENICDEDRIRK